MACTFNINPAAVQKKSDFLLFMNVLIDMVWIDLGNEVGDVKDNTPGAHLGLSGGGVIYPRQGAEWGMRVSHILIFFFK